MPKPRDAQAIYFGANVLTIPVIRIAARSLSARLRRWPGSGRRWGSRGRVVEVLHRPDASKAEIVRRGQELEVPFALTQLLRSRR